MQSPKALEEVQRYAVGTWESLSVELQPTEGRTGTGTMTPTYLRRHFTYLSAEQFIRMITLFADNYGQLPLMEFEFKGSLRWGGPHPSAEGAWCIDIAAGQIVSDYDLIYFNHGLLFMGAKHSDGTPFDSPERRPHQLQIPLRRASV